MRTHAQPTAAADTAQTQVHPLQRSCACGEASGMEEPCAACSTDEKLAIRPKLRINPPGDRWEQEADRIADHVVTDRPVSPTGPLGVSPLVQRQATGEIEDLQAKGAVRGASSSALDRAAVAVASSGRPLSAAERDYFEPRFGRDLSAVRLHTDARAGAASLAIDARAYTLGNHVAFAPGAFDSQSTEGRRLIAHELVHTLQQTAPRPPGAAAVSRSPRSDRSGLSVTPSVAGARIQRQCPPPVRKRGGAAGCGICFPGSIPGVGTAVHLQVQYAFFAKEPLLIPEGGLMEFVVPTVPEGQTPPFRPEVDLAMIVEEHGLRVIYIGELKPFDDRGRQRGIALNKLNDYARELRAGGLFDEVRLLAIDPPGEIPFANPSHPPGCPRQRIHTCFIQPGVYQYYCKPPWADLVSDSRCSCREEEERRQRRRREERRRDRERTDRPPDPVLIPEDPRGQRPGDQRPEVPEPVPVPVPVPVPAPVPGPETAPEPEVPETEPETPDGDVIPFPGRPEPEVEPEGEVLPEAARIALAALASVSALVALQQLSRRLPRAAMRRVIAPLEAAALAALVIVYSDRVEASVGGDSPLEGLFDAMANDGIPVPQDMRARIESDPALKAALERAAGGGDLDEAHSAIAERTLQIVAENPDAFSEQDLRLLAEMSEVTGGSSAVEPTVETLRRAIEARRQGRPIQEVLPEAQAGTESTTPETEAERPPAAEPIPNVSPQLLAQLAENTAVERLFRAMAGRVGQGPEIDDEVVRRFLEIVPDDLSVDEAKELIERLVAVQGQTLEEILQGLENAVEAIREGKREAGEGQTAETEERAEEGVEPQSEEAPAPEEGQLASGLTESEAIAKIKSFLAGNPPPGRFSLPQGVSIAPDVTLTILMSNNAIGGRITGGFVRFTLVERVQGRKWRIVLHPTRFYDAEGAFVGTFPASDTPTEADLPSPSRGRSNP